METIVIIGVPGVLLVILGIVVSQIAKVTRSAVDKICLESLEGGALILGVPATIAAGILLLNKTGYIQTFPEIVAWTLAVVLTLFGVWAMATGLKFSNKNRKKTARWIGFVTEIAGILILALNLGWIR